jgi:DNA repair exonuclease SbcCD ATPase subunit
VDQEEIQRRKKEKYDGELADAKGICDMEIESQTDVIDRSKTKIAAMEERIVASKELIAQLKEDEQKLDSTSDNLASEMQDLERMTQNVYELQE